MVSARPRNYGCRIAEFTVDGLCAVALENATLRVGVLAGKGADIYELLYKPRDVDMLWRSPNGIVNPARGTPTIPSAEGAFMDCYEGGWQELFPTLGPPVTHRGAEFGAHGEVALLPWEYRIEQDDADGVRVTFTVRTRRTPFAVRRTLALRAGAPVLYIEEEIANEGAEPLEYMWGHHPVLGAPFLRPGCLLAVPGGAVNTVRLREGRLFPSGVQMPWPAYRTAAGHEEDLRRLPEPDPSHVDELFLSDLPASWWAVTNPACGVGFALRWDTRVFPYLWLWRTLGPAPGYPWYGRTYTLGLEPFSSVPPHLEDALAAGTAPRLEPGETRATTLVAAAFAGTAPAVDVSDDGTVTLDRRAGEGGTGGVGGASAAGR